ncbi:aspartate aminotransferase family protein [Pseudogracilibacillus auburnensis]|uniref:Adenosylmethionine-8-amino-7-oxononanoate aminotransferase n=1 Tax=Pseudogracilibacillus auburnensis TaxID=1494959 RepID=A0A2V3VVC0_9BACI|nr:aspartate aminotransferase family protein [Pseudogracilibacillus auburnensis]PXW85912.1 adenosylmethionine-8-amino-7-oxononanoate aminotransferase [Pseudogracilibacillus auburnensis]
MNKNAVETNKVNELVELDKQHFIHPSTNPHELVAKGPGIIFSEGKGIYVKNMMDGKEYIDGMSMLWNVNIGHGQEEVVDAGKEQMSKIAYSSAFKGFSNEPAIKLAKKLADLAPGDLNAVFFTSGGSESNDTVIKFARFYWGLKGKPTKRSFISLNSAYHGVTLAAQTVTAIPAFHEFAGSNIDEIFHAKPHLLNCELGDKTDPNYEQSIRGIIEREGADTIAGIIMEPVQGAGGVNIPPEGYLQAVRKICDEFGILFIADEVICGFARTGKMFGVENWDVVPDMMSIAKGITSGYAQLGGVMLNDEVRNTIVDYDGMLAHGFTYSAHATACAIALKNIEIIERENVVENVQAMELELKKGLAFLAEKHSIVTNTRCIGLLGAFELYEDPSRGKLFGEDVFPANKVVDECFKRQLILRALGAHNHIIAIAPPLVTNAEEMEKIIHIIDEALTTFK